MFFEGWLLFRHSYPAMANNYFNFSDYLFGLFSKKKSNILKNVLSRLLKINFIRHPKRIAMRFNNVFNFGRVAATHAYLYRNFMVMALF